VTRKSTVVYSRRRGSGLGLVAGRKKQSYTAQATLFKYSKDSSINKCKHSGMSVLYTKLILQERVSGRLVVTHYAFPSTVTYPYHSKAGSEPKPASHLPSAAPGSPGISSSHFPTGIYRACPTTESSGVFSAAWHPSGTSCP
jgi:hypothetical protein